MKISTLTILHISLLLGIMPSTVFSQPYVISADGSEVTDQKTGLIWRRCSEGMYWYGATCLGDADTVTYEAALEHAAEQAGMTHIGWRLPEMQELYSIVDMDSNLDLVDGVKLAAIDITAFPETPASWFWSASLANGNPANAMDVDFYDGLKGSVGSSVNKRYHVRLVRTGK